MVLGNLATLTVHMQLDKVPIVFIFLFYGFFFLRGSNTFQLLQT